MNVQEVFGIGPPAEEPKQEENHPSAEALIHKVLTIALNQLKGEQHHDAGAEAYQAVYDMIRKYSPNEANKSAREAQKQSSQFAQDTRSQRWT